jgi:hypothetical protein
LIQLLYDGSVTATAQARWLMLIHQIPPKPNYLRVKIGRRLQALGAVAVKNSVYVLPAGDQALEDFQWVRKEIVAGGGDASVCEARFVEGLSDAAVEALFNAAREADYRALIREARSLEATLSRRKKGAPAPAAAALARIRRQLGEVVAIDFFGADGRGPLESRLAAIDGALRPPATETGKGRSDAPIDVRGRTWVTRSDVHVDRIASAWLIGRFIDPEARFRFEADPEYAPGPGELRFDMFEAEFTHEGDECTFEVLLRRFGVKDPALRPIAEIVHDVDLKDGKFARREATGIERLIAGIVLRHEDDESRLRDGGAALDSLHEYFKRKG